MLRILLYRCYAYCNLTHVNHPPKYLLLTYHYKPQYPHVVIYRLYYQNIPFCIKII